MGTLHTKHVADPNGLNKDVADTEFPDTHTLPTLMAEETTRRSTAGCLAPSLRRSPALPCWVTARAAPRSPPACRSKRNLHDLSACVAWRHRTSFLRHLRLDI